MLRGSPRVTDSVPSWVLGYSYRFLTSFSQLVFTTRMSRHVKSLSSDLHAIKKWKYPKASFHSIYYLILSVFSSFNRLVKSEIEIFRISRSDHNTYHIISQRQNEITPKTHKSVFEKEESVVYRARGKWPSNSLDVPWPAGEGGTVERCWGRRGTSIRTPIIREKVTCARRRCGGARGR